MLNTKLLFSDDVFYIEKDGVTMNLWNKCLVETAIQITVHEAERKRMMAK